MIYPTLIVFAGPNGAGKSTLKRRLEALNYPLGVYINPDDIAATLGGTYEARSRVAQSIAEQRRQACIARREDFSFETVMSHPSKIALMRQAAAAGYTITLFFVSVEDPEICVARVRQRVALGGHDVPVERIVRRYQATMSALGDAVRTADRTVLFDNSILAQGSPNIGPRTVAEVIGSRLSTFAPVPEWVEAFASRFGE